MKKGGKIILGSRNSIGKCFGVERGCNMCSGKDDLVVGEEIVEGVS